MNSLHYGLTPKMKPLSPKKIVQDIKTHWLEKAPDAVKAMKAAKLAGALRAG